MKTPAKVSDGPKRWDFTEKTKHAVRERAGGLCCYPNCLIPVKSGDINCGDVAHIYDALEGDYLRGRGGLTEHQIKDVKNGILLCANHHRISDSRKQPARARDMLEWKRVREISQMLALSATEIAFYYSRVGSYFLDGLVRTELKKKIPADGFNYSSEINISTDIDVDKISEACKEQFLAIARTTPSYHQLPEPPAHFSPTQFANTFKKLAPKIPVSTAVSRSSKQTTSEIASVINLIEKWRSPPHIRDFIDSGTEMIASRGNVGLVSHAHALVEKFDDMVTVDAIIIFAVEPDKYAKDKILYVKCYEMLDWYFTVRNLQGEWVIDSEIISAARTLPRKLQWDYSWNSFDEVRRWYRLLQQLDAGDNLVAVFAESLSELQGCRFPAKLKLHPLQISFSSVPKQLLQNTLRILQRALFVEELMLSWGDWSKSNQIRLTLDWKYSDDWLDPRITETALTMAIDKLQSAILTLKTPEWQTRLTPPNCGGRPLVLRYYRGLVSVCVPSRMLSMYRSV